eukprot:2305303-Prymnesium_polylepis.2
MEWYMSVRSTAVPYATPTDTGDSLESRVERRRSGVPHAPGPRLELDPPPPHSTPGAGPPCAVARGSRPSV